MLASRIVVAVALLVPGLSLAGTPFVPGTGDLVHQAFDDFEAENWSYRLNLPKSSYEQDDNQRGPGGYSNNKLWHEGAKRGTPDVVKRVATPPGGIPGSKGALMFQTKNSGIPGRVTGQQQQDDLLMKVDRRLGRSIPVTWQPSAVVRVYLPPFDQWEQRTGASFGMRGDCRGRRPEGDVAAFWPGMFILFKKANGGSIPESHAQLTVRASTRGGDMRSKEIDEPGWWTLGMSFTPDGQIHYYASEGVDDLTEEDYLTSSFAYNYRALAFDNFFFNVANWDNGRSWSTAWIIDDPKVFVQPPAGESIATLKRRKGQRVPTFPITHIHDADKPKGGNGFFDSLFGGSKRTSRGYNRSASGRSTKKRR
ncbi:MAG: hypothetical protein AAF266_14750 [Planctomycetota bacterium]